MKASVLLVVTLLGVVAGTTAAQEGPQTVVIMPFSALGTSDGTNGIGVGTQQVLLAELGRIKSVQAVGGTVAGPWPVTIELATKAAKDAGANFVIYGSYHLHERDVRITGQVLDVRANRFIGGLKATGAARDLFAVQDVIVQQVRRIIRERLTPPPVVVEPADGEAPVAEEPAPPLIEPLGAVRAVPAWDDPDPVVARARERIANQHDYDRVSYAYRNTYGFAPLYGFNFGYSYPYYPGVYYRHRGHHHHHHHRHR